MIAEVKQYTGTPTLFLDGKPSFYSLMWGAAPETDRYLLADCARYYGEAGIHLFTFDIGSKGVEPDWVGPQKNTDSPYNFSTLENRLQRVIDSDPAARFHLRVHVEMPDWWQALYPDECELLSDGRRMCQSYASKIWQQQASDYLRALVAHLRSIDLYDRVIAYQVGAGDTGEWVKGYGSMAAACGDFSAPMQNYFKKWLRKTYNDDSAALRKAWNDPTITFEEVEVPAADIQLSSSLYTFRNPQAEQHVIDYYKALADLCGDLVIDYCTVIKEATQGEALAGVFFGYLMELAWNSSFFGERNEVLNSHYATYQRSGHLGLHKVLRSEHVDFLVSPYSYGFRGIGGEGPSMLPSESLRIHGKIYLFEEDSRTHITIHDHPNYGKADTLQETEAILKRNLAYTITHGQGIWWLAGGSPKTPHIELSQQPAFRPLLKRFQEVGQFSQHLDRAPSAEVAVLLDDESLFYETMRNELDLPLIFQQRLWGLPRMGAPFDTYLLQDLIEDRLPPYKLYILLNAFQLDENRRQALKNQIRKEGRTALWIYAPGFIKDSPSLDHMADLTGFRFGMGEIPWGPLMYITNFQHPITQDLSQDLFWGTNSRLGPVFNLEDHQSTTLGYVVHGKGRCRPGFGVKTFPNWTSIYIAAPNIPAQVLRGIARYAGVHIYNELGDVLYATPELLGVHTLSGGERDFHLPDKVEVVYDLFADQQIAENVGQFQVNLDPISTSLYFTGAKKTLGLL